eukprot:5969776-Alexandrium_andersonii.AAC.1
MWPCGGGTAFPPRSPRCLLLSLEVPPPGLSSSSPVMMALALSCASLLLSARNLPSATRKFVAASMEGERTQLR